MVAVRFVSHRQPRRKRLSGFPRRLRARRFPHFALEFEALSDRVVAPGVNHAEREEGRWCGEHAGKSDYAASSRPACRGGRGHVLNIGRARQARRIEPRRGRIAHSRDVGAGLETAERPDGHVVVVGQHTLGGTVATCSTLCACNRTGITSRRRPRPGRRRVGVQLIALPRYGSGNARFALAWVQRCRGIHGSEVD